MALPFLLSPPTNPIGIDAGVDYSYVIAQSGATSITVDVPAGFQMSISGSVLNLRYTGSTPAVPLTYSATVHITNADGTINQTIGFQVAPADSLPRHYPSIISAGSTAAGLGAPVNYQIATDIPLNLPVAPFTAGIRFAQGLPSGLSFNSSSGLITGTPPLVNATYAIVLGAKIGNPLLPTSLRRWLLVVGAGGSIQDTQSTGQGGTGTQTGIGVVSTGVLYDGDYTVAQLVGMPLYEAPFAPHDLSLYVYRATYWQFQANYQEPALDSVGPIGGLYAGTVKGSFSDIGGGIIQFVREYATVPHPRDEYDSYVYSYQLVGTVNGAIVNNIGELPLTVMSRIHYDYFHVTDSGINGSGWVSGTPPVNSWTDGSSAATVSQIPLPRAPRVASVPVGNDSAVVLLNGWGTYFEGQEMLAEDAVAEQWKGSIYQRKQRFIIQRKL